MSFVLPIKPARQFTMSNVIWQITGNEEDVPGSEIQLNGGWTVPRQVGGRRLLQRIRCQPCADARKLVRKRAQRDLMLARLDIVAEI